jgi:hypothetical protein
MPRFYSQRMLNPYHGIVNVVEIEGADAVSRDGLNWMLYIQGGTESERRDGGVECEVSLPDVKFGTWSRRTGLRRAPVRYVTDYDQLDRLGSRLLEAVKSRADEAPFPHGDNYELWLLDADEALPIALLDSSCRQADTQGFGCLRWTPGQAALRYFGQRHQERGSMDGAERLTGLVRAAAGPNPTAQWFRREPGGRGEGIACNRSAAGLEARRLGRRAFPELLLRSDWPCPKDSALVADFHAWQAPWLLALQTISRSTRRRLEAASRMRALLVDQLYPTYPLIIDHSAIRSARVEATIRRSAGDRSEDEPAPASFFVTGN